jgi:hypothetical protein
VIWYDTYGIEKAAIKEGIIRVREWEIRKHKHFVHKCVCVIERELIFRIYNHFSCLQSLDH